MSFVPQPLEPLGRTKSFDLINSRLSAKPTDTPVKADGNEELQAPLVAQPPAAIPLLSTNTTESCEKAPIGTQAEKVHFLLSEMLVQTAELNAWKAFVRDVDFSRDPGPVFLPHTNVVECSPSTSTAVQQPPHDWSEEESFEVLAGDHSEDEESGDPAVDHVVKSLVRHFKKRMPAEGEELVYAITEAEKQQDPERIAELLKSWRGSAEWPAGGGELTAKDEFAPLKREFIYDLHEFDGDFVEQIRKQNGRCAGCRRSIDAAVHPKRALYCHYFNRLFCPLCHQRSKARIPARVLHKWDFTEHLVCDLAFNFLHDIENQPLFDVHALDTSLCRRVSNLNRIRRLRLEVSHLWQFISRCPEAEGVQTKYGPLRTMFESIPARFLHLEHVDCYSMLDFEAIRNGNLIDMLEPLSTCGQSHVVNCVLCQERGFICNLCRVPRVIFPFQLNKVTQCQACGGLSHAKCHEKQLKRTGTVFCDRCQRIHRKRPSAPPTGSLARRVWSRLRRRRGRTT